MAKVALGGTGGIPRSLSPQRLSARFASLRM